MIFVIFDVKTTLGTHGDSWESPWGTHGNPWEPMGYPWKYMVLLAQEEHLLLLQEEDPLHVEEEDVQS